MTVEVHFRNKSYAVFLAYRHELFNVRFRKRIVAHTLGMSFELITVAYLERYGIASVRRKIFVDEFYDVIDLLGEGGCEHDAFSFPR